MFEHGLENYVFACRIPIKSKNEYGNYIQFSDKDCIAFSKCSTYFG